MWIYVDKCGTDVDKCTYCNFFKDIIIKLGCQKKDIKTLKGNCQPVITLRVISKFAKTLISEKIT